MISTSDFRNGTKIELEGEPYAIVEFQHVKPGKGGGFVRTRLKNLKTGQVLDRTFRWGERLPEPDLQERTLQFLYAAEDGYHFMDMETYDQTALQADQLGESRAYLKEGMEIKALYHRGQPIGVELPMFVELAVVQTEPGIKGDTASGGSKPAVLETGATVKVPLYLNEGDVIRVDTRTGTYIERVREGRS